MAIKRRALPATILTVERPVRKNTLEYTVSLIVETVVHLKMKNPLRSSCPLTVGRIILTVNHITFQSRRAIQGEAFHT